MRFDMENAKTIDTPMLQLLGWIKINLVPPLMKRNTEVRLGLCFTKLQVCQILCIVWVVKRMLRYLMGTQDMIFWYPTRDFFDLIRYEDVEYQEENIRDDSFPWVLFDFMESKKQNYVALSTTEDKYVEDASCCAQLLWIKKQLEDFGVMSSHIL